MEWEVKAQNFLLAIIVAAIFNFIIGSVMGPSTPEQKAEGFTGISRKFSHWNFEWKQHFPCSLFTNTNLDLFSVEVFAKNWGPDYRFSEKLDQSFFSVFAIFFPSGKFIEFALNWSPTRWVLISILSFMNSDRIASWRKYIWWFERSSQFDSKRNTFGIINISNIICSIRCICWSISVTWCIWQCNGFDQRNYDGRYSTMCLWQSTLYNLNMIYREILKLMLLSVEMLISISDMPLWTTQFICYNAIDVSIKCFNLCWMLGSNTINSVNQFIICATFDSSFRNWSHISGIDFLFKRLW